jgi:hypothetical protein
LIQKFTKVNKNPNKNQKKRISSPPEAPHLTTNSNTPENIFMVESFSPNSSQKHKKKLNRTTELL